MWRAWYCWFGVAADGATYAGTYDASTHFGAFRVGPGVAPLAQIYALKVFGCTGSSDITDVAIEWAVDPNGDGDFADAVDVINLSLGSPYGNGYDTTTVAANNAGGHGRYRGCVGRQFWRQLLRGRQPVHRRPCDQCGSQPEWDRGWPIRAHPHRYARQLFCTLAAAQRRSPETRSGGAGVSILSAASLSGNSGRAPSGTSMAAPHVAGTLALLRQLHPSWSVEELKALLMNTAMPLVCVTTH